MSRAKLVQHDPAPSHLPLRAASLDAVEHCGLVGTLSKAARSQNYWTVGGNAFDAGLEWVLGEKKNDVAHSRYENYMVQLEPEDRHLIEKQIDKTIASLSRESKEDLRVQLKFAFDRDGMPCSFEDGRAMVRGRMDCRWLEPGIVNVLDFKRGMGSFAPPETNLQLWSAALHEMHIHDRTKCRLWICHMAPDASAPKFHASPVLGEEEAETAWARIKLAAARDPSVANKSDHCLVCWERAKCPAWMAPAVDVPARDIALAPLFLPDQEASADQVLKLLLLVDQMEEWTKLGKSYVRSWVARNGGVPYGDREFRMTSQAGRRSTSIAALEQAGLLDEAVRLGAVKDGAPATVFRWMKRRMLDGKAKEIEGEGGIEPA